MTTERPGQRPEYTALVLRNVVKLYGRVRAVDGVSLEVRSGEFLTLLGPSGSGKTTVLRMIAGFIGASSGSIEVGGKDVSGVPPYQRDVGMVFQNYALFPHMTAAENIAFPLEMRHVPRKEITSRVDEVLALVKLGGLQGRYPRQLSGGQQQRVALARAVVFRPRLLLMDEPLGALDKKLRETLQLEIVHVSRQLGATVVYVTHDQEEALVMSDRIAIFRGGKIEQTGRGQDLYDHPASLFAATFIGESNLFQGRYGSVDGRPCILQGSCQWEISEEAATRSGLHEGDLGVIVVRPEKVRLCPPGAGDGHVGNRVSAVVSEIIYLGMSRKYVLMMADGTTVIVRRQSDDELAAREGEVVSLGWHLDDGVVLRDSRDEIADT